MVPAQGHDVRRVLCTSCDAPISIAAQAKSVSCPHCNQRVVTEAVTVKDSVAVRKFFVANTMRITKKGMVYASIRADDVRIDGLLQGEALALGRLHLGKSARVQGQLRATYLRVDAGAAISGDVRIGPDEVPELDVLIAGEVPASTDGGE